MVTEIVIAVLVLVIFLLSVGSNLIIIRLSAKIKSLEKANKILRDGIVESTEKLENIFIDRD